MAMTARLDLSDPALAAAVADVRDDKTDTAWCQFGYENKAKIVLSEKGTGGVDELLDAMDDSQVSYALLRLTTGDQESKRIKFMCDPPPPPPFARHQRPRPRERPIRRGASRAAS